jgi:hypothetical protein
MAGSTASAAAKAADKEAGEAAARAEKAREDQVKQAQQDREKEFKEAEKEHDSEDSIHTAEGAIRQPEAPLAHPFTTTDNHGIERIVSPAPQSWSPAPVDPDPAAVKAAEERLKREADAKKARTTPVGERS